MITTSTIVYITRNLVAVDHIVLCGPPITRHLATLKVALRPSVRLSVCQSEHVTRE